jgi:hypothetical protein
MIGSLLISLVTSAQLKLMWIEVNHGPIHHLSLSDSHGMNTHTQTYY